MKVLTYMGHPAHFHMLKHVIADLRSSGAQVHLLARPKDVLHKLLVAQGWEYCSVLPDTQAWGGKVGEWLAREARAFREIRRFAPDVLIGTSAEIAHVGRLLNRPSVLLSEDDYEIIPKFARVAYPFASVVCCPAVCDAGPWARKKVGYRGFQKLAYLHPNRFRPDPDKVQHLGDGADGRFSLVRLVKLTAHHDRGVRGFDLDTVTEAIERLEALGPVYLSAEGDLPESLGRHRLPLPPEDIHHALAFAQVYLGDSQSMAVEAAMLGTPSLRFSDFAGRIRVLEELERRYRLTVGFHTRDRSSLFELLDRITADPDELDEWRGRRDEMLADMIDVSSFWTWMLEELAGSGVGARVDEAMLERLRRGGGGSFT